MLILTRKSQEAVVVTGPCRREQLLKIEVLEVRGGRVKLAFDAGEEVPIFRQEVWERIRAENQAGNPPPTEFPVDGRIVAHRSLAPRDPFTIRGGPAAAVPEREKK